MAMHGFNGRRGMAPPPVPLQPGRHQRSSPTSSGAHQQQQQPPQPGYPTFPVGSLGEIDAERGRVDDGLSPSGHTVTYQAQQQQQQQPLGYPTQQYQSQTDAHWYGSGAQPTHAPVSPPSQPTYGYSPASPAGPSYNQHAHAVHAPTGNPSMYAAPIPTAASQWTSGSSTRGQEQYYYPGPATHPPPAQAYQQPPYTSPTHATETHTPAGSSKRYSSMAPAPFSLNATVPLVTGPLSPPAGSKGEAAGPSVPLPLLILRSLTGVVAPKNKSNITIIQNLPPTSNPSKCIPTRSNCTTRPRM